MNQLRKVNSKYRSGGILTAAIFCTLTCKIAFGYTPPHRFDSSLTTHITITDTIPKTNQRSDTIPKRKPTNDSIIIKNSNDTIPGTDSLLNDSLPKQRIDTFSFKASKDSLDAPVHYEAEDSVVVMMSTKKIYLYGKTKTEYKDITLTAPKVELDQQTQMVTAFSSRDSLGEIAERAHFNQGETAFQSDTIFFNFKTQKGLTKNTYTVQNDIFIKSELLKKSGNDVLYGKNGVMTTCDLDEPHFGFHYTKIKVVNNKVGISGPINPEFEGVPIPLYLPFGIFPMNRGRHSGFLPPQFTTNEQYGLGLEGIGYYKVLSAYFDLTLRGNIYSYGGWTANITPSYRKRYKYQGALNFSIQSTKFNFKGDPDYNKNTSYFINWNHSSDTRARPGTTFAANVSAGSTSFNKFVANSPERNFQNQLQSSISYSKSWVGKPYNLTINANHNQNNLLHLINVSLPDVGFSVTTQYPLQRKEFAGSPKWYEKLGIGYNGAFRNQFSFYDTAFSFKRLIDTLQWGAQHNIPITLALPPVLNGALMISPGVSYQQVWIAQKMRRTWNPVTQKADTTVTKGLFLDHSTSFSLGLSTALYGTFQFKRSKTAIRHVIRPSLSFSYKPDLSKSHFYDFIDSTNPAAIRRFRFSEFEGSLYGGFAEGKYGGISLTVDNNLEMKKRSKKDTADGGMKKVKLIDGYGFSVNYNMMADSFRLSPISLYLRSTLFEKINITANATLNPYDYDQQGFPVDKLFNHNGKFSWGRLTNGSISISSSFQSKPKDEKKDQDRKKAMNELINDPTLGGQGQLLDEMRTNPSAFVDFNIPWNVSFGLSVFFSEVLKPDLSGFEKNFSSNLNFNGGFNLTPKWNLSVNGYYDFDTRKLQTFQMNISREMHCWQMSVSVTPIGLYRFFSINISPKASILQDLKVNRTKYFPNFQ